MSAALQVSIGQHSRAGRKDINQDCCGARVPAAPLLITKGIAVALADGISSSRVGRIAAEAAVQGFLSDYYATAETWSVQTSVVRVLKAANSWLSSQTTRAGFHYDRDRGYVCTFSALVLKADTAHLFHVGDTRIYRLCGDGLEQLTRDHRLVVSAEESYLSRALGVDTQLDLDYRSLPAGPGDVFLLATDGVYEHVPPQTLVALAREHGDDLEAAARAIVDAAYERGSPDNLTAQLLRIDASPAPRLRHVHQHSGTPPDDGRSSPSVATRSPTEMPLVAAVPQRSEVPQLTEVPQLSELPFAPIFGARARVDGYTIVRPLYASSRSHVYLATDDASGRPVVIKAPSVDVQQDSAHVERFLLEEWIARRIDSPHVLKAAPPERRRSFLYSVMEHVDGQTLGQWMVDHPQPSLAEVRGIIEQIARGLQAFHRLEMLHRDLRPDNIMIDTTGTLKIIDFGATQVAGLDEIELPLAEAAVPGTVQYAAPEYFLGETGSRRSDLFSLAVIAYQMLSGGRLPYGAALPRARTRSAQRALRYASVLDDERAIPMWVDTVLRTALHADPAKRYEELSEFVHDLRQPSPRILDRTRPPLIERNPLLFWKGLSLVLAVLVVVLLLTRPG